MNWQRCARAAGTLAGVAAHTLLEGLVPSQAIHEAKQRKADVNAEWPCDTGDCWYDAHGHVCPHPCGTCEDTLNDYEAEHECVVGRDEVL